MTAARFDTVGARATFLSEASRRLAGCLDVRQALLTALCVVVPELAGWAQIALLEPDATKLVARAADATRNPVAIDSTTPRTAHTGLGRIARTGRAERLCLDPYEEEPTREPGALLAPLIPDDGLRATATALHPVDVLAIPLVARGSTFGALILLRGREGPFGEHERSLAEDVAGRIGVAIDVAKIYEERAHMASVLQASLRPPTLPDIAGMRLAARYRAAVEHIEIGGDFFDVHGADDDWTVVIGDVCGKGIEAAVLTGRSRQTVRTAAHLDRSPARMLAVLNEVLYEADSDRFVTTVCARLRPDPACGGARMDVAVAGHPAPVVIRTDGKVEPVAAHGMLCGVQAGAEYTETTVWLHEGDTVLLFTDGIYEARGPVGFYGMERLYELLPTLAGADPDAVCTAVENSVVAHLAGAQHDDMALLAVTCGTTDQHTGA